MTKRPIIVERNGVRFSVGSTNIHKYRLRYYVQKYEFKGVIHIAFLDRWTITDPKHRSIVRFMEKCGFEFVEQGQVWEIKYCPENWEPFTSGEFDDCLQDFWRNPCRHSGWHYIEFLK